MSSFSKCRHLKPVNLQYSNENHLTEMLCHVIPQECQDQCGPLHSHCGAQDQTESLELRANNQLLERRSLSPSKQNGRNDRTGKTHAF